MSNDKVKNLDFFKKISISILEPLKYLFNFSSEGLKKLGKIKKEAQEFFNLFDGNDRLIYQRKDIIFFHDFSELLKDCVEFFNSEILNETVQSSNLNTNFLKESDFFEKFMEESSEDKRLILISRTKIFIYKYCLLNKFAYKLFWEFEGIDTKLEKIKKISFSSSSKNKRIFINDHTFFSSPFPVFSDFQSVLSNEINHLVNNEFIKEKDAVEVKDEKILLEKLNSEEIILLEKLEKLKSSIEPLELLKTSIKDQGENADEKQKKADFEEKKIQQLRILFYLLIEKTIEFEKTIELPKISENNKGVNEKFNFWKIKIKWMSSLLDISENYFVTEITTENKEVTFELKDQSEIKKHDPKKLNFLYSWILWNNFNFMVNTGSILNDSESDKNIYDFFWSNEMDEIEISSSDVHPEEVKYFIFIKEDKTNEEQLRNKLKSEKDELEKEIEISETNITQLKKVKDKLEEKIKNSENSINELKIKMIDLAKNFQIEIASEIKKTIDFLEELKIEELKNNKEVELLTSEKNIDVIVYSEDKNDIFLNILLYRYLFGSLRFRENLPIPKVGNIEDNIWGFIKKDLKIYYDSIRLKPPLPERLPLPDKIIVPFSYEKKDNLDFEIIFPEKGIYKNIFDNATTNAKEKKEINRIEELINWSNNFVLAPKIESLKLPNLDLVVDLLKVLKQLIEVWNQLKDEELVQLIMVLEQLKIEEKIKERWSKLEFFNKDENNDKLIFINLKENF